MTKEELDLHDCHLSPEDGCQCQQERLNSIGFVSEQRLREEVAELKDDEVVYSHKTLTDREIRDENIKLSL